MWELLKSVTSCLEQIPEAIIHKAAIVPPLTSYLSNHPSMMNKTCGCCWVIMKKLISDFILWTPIHILPVLADQQRLIIISSVRTLGAVWMTSQERLTIVTDDQRRHGNSYCQCDLMMMVMNMPTFGYQFRFLIQLIKLFGESGVFRNFSPNTIFIFSIPSFYMIFFFSTFIRWHMLYWVYPFSSHFLFRTCCLDQIAIYIYIYICNIMAAGFRFMPLGLVMLRTFRFSAWVS